MPTRRTFLEGTIAASTLAASAPFARGTSPRPAVILVERGVTGSALFEAEMRSRGLAVIVTGSDLAGVWMRVLEPRLRALPEPIVGLTHPAPLFCLELLARDYGLLTALRIEHRCAAGPCFEHRVTALAPDTDWERLLGLAGAHWAAAAAALASDPALPPAMPAVALLDVAAANEPEPAAFTWMLVPDRRRRWVGAQS